MLDPSDFIITRKRKKYKFAKFANSPLCYELDEWQPTVVDSLEVGAGDGRFSVQLAQRHPEQHHLAVDVKGDRLQKGAYEAEAQGTTNIQFVRARADQLAQLCKPHSLQTVWVTFPDPFPKKRSAGRRLTHPSFLALYAQLLAPGGSLLLKHDNPEFFAWSLESLVASGWLIRELYFDLHETQPNIEYELHTSYEQRWLGEGRTIHCVRATPPL
jgi:tRNA (guanine-N7-)-methyltransferase